jgi:hypothetical protein
VGITGSSAQNVSSTSIDWGTASSCNVGVFTALGCTLVLFLDLDWLAVALTSIGTSLVPRECTRVSHSITLAVDFVRQRLAAFTVLWMRGME